VGDFRSDSNILLNRSVGQQRLFLFDCKLIIESYVFNMADLITAITIAGQHSFFGSIENRGLRLLEVLNDVNSNYLNLYDVVVRRGIQGECIDQFSETTIPKSAVDIVLLEPDKHEAPHRRAHAFVPKDSRAALILLGDYEIRGTFMFLKGPLDAIRSLRLEPMAFFPVISPRLSRVSGADPPLSAGVALINGLKVSLLQLKQQAVGSVS
jgi:hypothetical protein